MKIGIWELFVRTVHFLTGHEVLPIKTYNEIAFAKMYGNVLQKERELRCTQREECTHRKGGMIYIMRDRSLLGSYRKGDSEQFAVLKHQLMNGDWFIRCFRCSKTWVKPIRSKFPKGYYGDSQFAFAEAEYKDMILAPTIGCMSSAIQVRGDDHFNRLVRRQTALAAQSA
jgi:hypothetical protein